MNMPGKYQKKSIGKGKKRKQGKFACMRQINKQNEIDNL